MATRFYKEEDDDDLFGRQYRRNREGGGYKVRIELPPPFSGEDGQNFLCWARQFEVAVQALAEGESNRSYVYELCRILPTRLSKAAFLLWDSLPTTVQADYEAVKERLKEAFGHKQFVDRFRASLSARPRGPGESLEVFAAEISRLVHEAFPHYGEIAQKEEKFRRFLAGLDPGLRAKCHEQGATDLEEALTIAGRCENARETMKMDYLTSRDDGASGAPVVAVRSVSSDYGLSRAVDKLVEEMKDMKMEMRRVAEENRTLRARASNYGGWRDSISHSPSRDRCRCACGGRGCQAEHSQSLQRGRSPEKRSYEPREDYQPPAGQRDNRAWSPGPAAGQRDYRAWSPGRRSLSPGRRAASGEESRRRGVRFLSPAGDRQGNEK